MFDLYLPECYSFVYIFWTLYKKYNLAKKDKHMLGFTVKWHISFASMVLYAWRTVLAFSGLNIEVRRIPGTVDALGAIEIGYIELALHDIAYTSQQLEHSELKLLIRDISVYPVWRMQIWVRWTLRVGVTLVQEV